MPEAYVIELYVPRWASVAERWRGYIPSTWVPWGGGDCWIEWTSTRPRSTT